MSKGFGKYRVVAGLGHGGTARVYLTVLGGSASFSKLMVIKVLRPELADEPAVRLSFQQEARLAARLNHRNVVHTFEVSEEDGYHYIAMEYLDGQPLDRILERTGALDIPLALRLKIVTECLQGLRYAHELRDFDGAPLNVVHRDISPQNIFVTYDGQVKLMDFGIAKVRGLATGTETGMFKGKVGYCAPEQVMGDQVDVRADLFAMGVVLYELLTGKRFSSDDMLVAANERISGKEQRMAERNEDPSIANELATICDRALAVEPEDRFGSAMELSDALEAFVAQSSDYEGRSKELARFVASAFVDDRKRLQRKIDTQLRRVEDATGSQSVPIIELTARTDTQLGAGTSTSLPTSGSSSFPLWALAVAAAVLVVVSLVFVFREGPKPADGKTASSVVSSVSATEPEPQPAPSPSVSSEPPVENEPQRIMVQISAQPDSAQIFLDGTELPRNPFQARLERDGKLHRVEAKAPGHYQQTRLVAFDRDVTLALTCVPRRVAPGPVRQTPKEPKRSIDIDVEDPYKR